MATNSPRYDGHQYAQVSGPPSPQTTVTGGRVSMEPSSVLLSPPSRYASPVSPFPQTEHHKSSNITFVPIVDTDEDPQYGHTPTGNPVTRTWSAIGNWWPEIASSLFSLLCIPALVILLRSYDDRPLSEWYLTITPNIVIAFIFTICRISFIYPLVQALAQQRWNWFKSPRSLDDFRVFDEASRGPWGSLLLMIRMKGRPLGILSRPHHKHRYLDSHSSIVTYPSRMVPVMGNDTAVAKKVDEFYYVSGNRANGRLFPLQQALRSSGSTTPIQLVPYPPPTCRTSECTWPGFNTMAICVNMTNVTSLLTYDDLIPGTSEWHRGGRPRTNVSLSNGVSFQPYPYRKAGRQIGLDVGIGAGLTSNWSEPHRKQEIASLSFNGIEGQKAELTSIFLLYSDPIRATEVMFHYCVNRYNMSISENVPKIQLLESSTKVEYHNAEHHHMYKTLVDPQNSSVTYKFGSTSNHFLTGMLRDFFINDRDDEGYVSVLLYQLPFSKGNDDKEEKDEQGLDDFRYDVVRNMSLNVAMGLTNITMQAVSSLVSGTAWQEERYISVRFGLALVVLVLVMVQTARLGVPVVKSDILPAFFAVGLAERAEAERGRVSDVGFSPEVKKNGAKPEESFALMGELQKTQKGKWVLEGLYRGR
ncbi:LOW QUALITY PROTEIN: uncharacterized protein QC763_200780 [Podospora pseudopauciseta]|uniref:Uncharacterized protein n=1 Tax=Podospora pseudopauciseta TaxID=2093780 RepID=A0ABR0HN06_9PEZI|nr:LOW QUALITY PROTEIN: hypothetical protein QC763_200780 [Podospora pseudopauciseta]